MQEGSMKGRRPAVVKAAAWPGFATVTCESQAGHFLADQAMAKHRRPVLVLAVHRENWTFTAADR